MLCYRCWTYGPGREFLLLVEPHILRTTADIVVPFRILLREPDLPRFPIPILEPGKPFSFHHMESVDYHLRVTSLRLATLTNSTPKPSESFLAV